MVVEGGEPCAPGDLGGLIVRILVIGGTHFIGPAAVRCLHKTGHDITLFHRGQTESDDLPDVRHIHGDGERLADYAEDFERLAHEVVLDMRAMSEADVRAVMGAFRGIAQRVVTVSSMDVYRVAGRTYNVGEADPLPEEEWVRAIGRAAGWSGEVVVMPRDRLLEQLRWGGDSDQDLVADMTRIRAELGYAEGASRDEALRRTVAWESANPPTDVLPDMFNYAAEDAALARVG